MTPSKGKHKSKGHEGRILVSLYKHCKTRAEYAEVRVFD